MSKFKTFAIFIGGVAVGVLASSEYFRRMYSAIAEEEIASVKAEYGRLRAAMLAGNDDQTEVNEEDDSNPDQPLDPEKAADVLAYAASLAQNGYAGDIDYSSMSRVSPSERMIQEEIEAVEDQEEIPDEPKVISPDEFGELLHYKQINLTYYEDGVLVDELGDPVVNIDETIGPNALNTFGEYEEDSVHVRNDRLRCEYEIIKDPRLYSDVLRTQPKKVEV